MIVAPDVVVDCVMDDEEFREARMDEILICIKSPGTAISGVVGRRFCRFAPFSLCLFVLSGSRSSPGPMP